VSDWSNHFVYKGMRRHINEVRAHHFGSALQATLADVAAGRSMVIIDLSVDQSVGTGPALAAGAVPAFFPISSAQCQEVAKREGRDTMLLRFRQSEADNERTLLTQIRPENAERRWALIFPNAGRGE
jgi:hypothetical protein